MFSTAYKISELISKERTTGAWKSISKQSPSGGKCSSLGAAAEAAAGEACVDAHLLKSTDRPM
jgi:hypothetical protein